MARYITDPWVRQLIDVEYFLLSGLKTHGTIAPKVAFMLSERNDGKVEYPIGGSGAIVEALIRRFKCWGGELRLGTHVDKILVKAGRVTGVKLRNGEVINDTIIISNATIWDTYNQLLSPEDLPFTYRKKALDTPTIDSFMHIHLGIKADGLENLAGHHVLIHDNNKDIIEPENTCMISIHGKTLGKSV